MHKLLAYFKISLVSLCQNRLRSLLSILGIVFGVMAVMVIIAVGEGMKKEALHQIEQLGIRNIYIRSVTITREKKNAATRKHGFGITRDDLARIRRGCQTVVKTAALKELDVTIIGAPREVTPQIAAITPSYAEVLALRLESGRFITRRDSTRLQEVCVVGHDISRALGKNGRLGSILRIEDHFFKIVGILSRCRRQEQEKTGVIASRDYDKMVLLPLGLMSWVARKAGLKAGEGGRHLSEIILQIDDSSHVLDSARIIARIMASVHPDVQAYQVVVPLELLHQTRKTKKMLTAFLVTIALVSLLVGGIGIMNIMLATVSERKKEIGIRRAVGARKRHILLQFLTESSILTFVGGLIGVCLGGAAMFVISIFMPWKAVLTVEAVLVPLLISSLTGVFFGIYPAYQAASTDPIQALRS